MDKFAKQTVKTEYVTLKIGPQKERHNCKHSHTISKASSKRGWYTCTFSAPHKNVHATDCMKCPNYISFMAGINLGVMPWEKMGYTE